MENKRIYRISSEKKLGGVAAGLAEYFEIDVTLVRLIFVLGAIFGVGASMIVYIAMWAIVPKKPNDIVRIITTENGNS